MGLFTQTLMLQNELSVKTYCESAVSSLFPSQIPSSFWKNKSDSCNGHLALCNCVLVKCQLFDIITQLFNGFLHCLYSTKYSSQPGWERWAFSSFCSAICSLGTEHGKQVLSPSLTKSSLHEFQQYSGGFQSGRSHFLKLVWMSRISYLRVSIHF